MQKMMNEIPENVLDVSAEKKNSETALIPAHGEELKPNKKFRMIYQLGNDFSRLDMRAMLDDAKRTFKNISSWDRIALVSDHFMINSFAKFFKYLTTCELRLFKNDEMDEAKSWITEK